MLQRSFTLPCGATLPNRLIKAALTERLADAQNRATMRHENLYRAWSRGGAGCLITGNVLIDRFHLEATGNVVIDERADLDALQRYARAGTEAGNHLWMQLSHAGRQTPQAINPSPRAPSAVPLAVKHGSYGVPTAMTARDIRNVVTGFSRAAAVARQTGFTGVQIHGAHGYLLSAFMNPRANRRDDEYGGALENRARLLLDVVAAIRAEAGHDFALSVKLNSADFQEGGFTLDDCAVVAGWLEAAGIDLLEVSGGNYENPAMLMGRRGQQPAVRESTLAREAFFIDCAAFLRRHTKVPLMVTGGFRTRGAMREALEIGAADVIGLGRTLCVEPDLPHKLMRDEADALEVESSIEPPYARMPWYYCQLQRLGDGMAPDLALTGSAAAEAFADREAAQLAAWRAAQA